MSTKTTTPGLSQGEGRPNLAALGAPPRPQVNLLPPEIASKRALGRVKGWLFISILVVVLVLGVGYVLAAMGRTQAADDLADTEAEAQRLMQEQTQYAEVPEVKAQITNHIEARLLATATEVLWPQYFRAIQAVLPEGVSITQMQTEMPGPGVATASSGSPLDMPNVGAVSFTAQAKSLPDMASWMDGLNSIEGFGSATYSTATLADNEGVVTYEITVQVRVDERVYANRFAEDAEDAGTSDGSQDADSDDEGSDVSDQEVGEH